MHKSTRFSEVYLSLTSLKFFFIFSLAECIASYMKPMAGFSSESTKRRTEMRGIAAMRHLLIFFHNRGSKTIFCTLFPSSVAANLVDFQSNEPNIFINPALCSYRHPKVKYAVANRVAPGLINSLPLVNFFNMLISIVLEYM